MAGVVQEKGRGLKFAERQLLRHGWEHGKGLGRAEDGISEAIKVKVKCDKGGVGHKEGEQFTFHWWDHVFNKASSSLQVESDQGAGLILTSVETHSPKVKLPRARTSLLNLTEAARIRNGIKLTKTAEEDEEDGKISNKKPRKAALAKAKLYGCFVKSATLLSGQEQPETKSSDSEDSSSSEDEDDQRLDLSSTTKLSDADLMKACGGRTAHKGARHGLTMNAKLARLEQQEAEFMAKYGGKNQTGRDSPAWVAVTPTSTTTTTTEEEEEGCEEEEKKKKKKKKKKKRSSESINELNGDEVSETPETDVQPKKKKKKKRKANEDGEERSEDVNSVGDDELNHSQKTKRKHKKKKNIVSQSEDERPHSAESPEVSVPPQTKDKKKKKRKSPTNHSKPTEESDDKESSQSEETAPDEAEVTESTVKQKKSKKDKTSVDDDEAPPTKRRKKKKKCKDQ